MAVAVDGPNTLFFAASGAATSFNLGFAVTVGASDNALYVAVTFNGNPGTISAPPAVAGVSMTQIGTTQNNGANMYATVWGLLNPTTGANPTFTATWTNSVFYEVAFIPLSGASTTSFGSCFKNFVAASGTGTALSVTITDASSSPTSNIDIAVASAAGNALTLNTGQTDAGFQNNGGNTTDWAYGVGSASQAFGFTCAASQVWLEVGVTVAAPSAATTPTGWNYINDDIFAKKPVIAFSASPAFVSTFQTAGIAGISWFEPPDRIKLPPNVAISAPPALVTSFRSAPISGMAWFEPRENDRLPKAGFLTDPVSLNYNPVTVTWAFSVGDTTFLRDPPKDDAPGYGHAAFASPAGISGMAWFEPADLDKPATKVRIESPPAIQLIPGTLPTPVSGIGWFEPPDRDKRAIKINGEAPIAFVSTPYSLLATIQGIGWFEPPDRDKRAVKISVEAPPAIALTPGTLPVPIRGMAWFEPPDRDYPAFKVKFDAPPGYVRFPVGIVTISMAASESADTLSFTMSFREVWVARTKESELWTPATKESETWTPN